jgi:hypothetical protein
MPFAAFYQPRRRAKSRPVSRVVIILVRPIAWRRKVGAHA